MTEDILHFVWKNNSSNFNRLKLQGEGEIEVLSTGEHNFDSGPDFFNAKIKIGQTVWAGNVEIHIKASDWNKHGHSENSAYDSVILHLVVNNDIQVLNSKGKPVPTLEIPYPNDLEWDLQRLVANQTWIPCANHLESFGRFNMRMWLASLAVERLEHKTHQVDILVNQQKGNWEEAFYISVARSFGLKINALPFELLAKGTPLRYIARTRDDLKSIEALLFGQAGMLNSMIENDHYMQTLLKEYQYQQKKFNLTPIPEHLWKFMRLRPHSFPTIRIAQFAQLINKSPNLLSKCLESNFFDELKSLFKVRTSSYWNDHYTFGNKTKGSKKELGDEAVRVIILNSVVPFMFAYGTARSDESLRDKALSFLEKIKPESNSIVRGFAKLGIIAENSFFSQAMVQLKDQYCDKRKCLYCKVGANVLLKRINSN